MQSKKTTNTAEKKITLTLRAGAKWALISKTIQIAGEVGEVGARGMCFLERRDPTLFSILALIAP